MTKHMGTSCLTSVECNNNMLVPWLLMSSYAYYCLNESLISDGLYDQLAKGLLLKWDDISHPHKNIIPKDDLLAGSLYKLTEADYPSIVIGATLTLIGGEKQQ